VYTWNLEEGIAFCMAFLAREAAKASARPAARALGGAAHGAHRLPEASLSVAQRGLGGAAHGLLAATSSPAELPLYCFPVPCMNNSMYSKKMRHFHVAGFIVESDYVIRFRKRDHLPTIADLLVGTGKFSRFCDAQYMVANLMKKKDSRVNDLLSFEVDYSLTEYKVGNLI